MSKEFFFIFYFLLSATHNQDVSVYMIAINSVVRTRAKQSPAFGYSHKGLIYVAFQNTNTLIGSFHLWRRQQRRGIRWVLTRHVYPHHDRELTVCMIVLLLNFIASSFYWKKWAVQNVYRVLIPYRRETKNVKHERSSKASTKQEHEVLSIAFFVSSREFYLLAIPFCAHKDAKGSLKKREVSTRYS